MPTWSRVSRSHCLWLCATLAACGGGSGDDGAAPPPPPAPLPSGLFGKVTGTHAGVLVPGTYTLAGCRNAQTEVAVSRKLRLDADGSLRWLNAAQGDAVLLQLVPSDSEHQNRQVSVQRSGSSDTTNGYTLSFERIAYDPTFRSDGFVQLNGKGDRLNGVQVRYPAGGATVQEECITSPTLERAGTLPMRLSTALVHEKLASLVALNGGTLAAAPYSYYGAQYTSVAIAADGSITTQAANAASATPWGAAWVEAFVFDSGLYREQYNSIGDSGPGSPADPAVSLTLQHPTLTVPYPNAGSIGQPLELRRAPGGAAPPVRYFGGAL